MSMFKIVISGAGGGGALYRIGKELGMVDALTLEVKYQRYITKMIQVFQRSNEVRKVSYISHDQQISHKQSAPSKG